MQERQDLTRQWDDAQEQMRRNDEAIAAATQLFADRNARLRDRQTRLDASAKALDEEMVGNKEREAQIELLNRSIERARAAYATEHVRCCLPVGFCGVLWGPLTASRARELVRRRLGPPRTAREHT